MHGGIGVKINKLTITGNITSTDGRAAGFITDAYGITLTNCYNKANIKGNNASGIFGSGSATLTECGNEGEIIANSDACGIGYQNTTTLNKCYNKGNVTSKGGAAGLRSWGGAGKVKNCFNIGNITGGGTSYAAGLTAWASGAISNCYNLGDITGPCKRVGSNVFGVGGICPTANNYSINATNCYSSGKLSITTGTDKQCSALLVAGDNSTRTNCFYLDGVPGATGISPRTGETIFYKTSTDPEVMTTAKMVQTFNNYIELKGVLQEGDTEVDTTGWCQWVVGEDNLPALDFNTEWNGTTWVTTGS